MAASARIGAAFAKKWRTAETGAREDFGVIEGATLTLLGLIIGFSFSMATGRYDQRKNYEEAEANAIGTEFVRADLLPAAEASRVRSLLKQYLDQRIQFYETDNNADVQQVDARVSSLQDEMWAAVVPSAKANPTQLTALVVSGMNDVLNSEGYTQSAWWYRIPPAAWLLMIAIAVACNLLMGYVARGGRSAAKLLLILPTLIAIAFMMIADIDAPRHGLIRVQPQNLTSLADSVRGKGVNDVRDNEAAAASDHFQIIILRQFRERGGGEGLIPERDAGDVVLEGEIAAVAAPAEGLDRHLKIGLEADRVGDVPAIQPETHVALVVVLGADDLGQAGVGAGEFLVLLGDRILEVVAAAAIILGARAADRGIFLVAVHVELDLALAPPAVVVHAPRHVCADILALAFHVVEDRVDLLEGQGIGAAKLRVEVGGVVGDFVERVIDLVIESHRFDVAILHRDAAA